MRIVRVIALKTMEVSCKQGTKRKVSFMMDDILDNHPQQFDESAEKCKRDKNEDVVKSSKFIIIIH